MRADFLSFETGRHGTATQPSVPYLVWHLAVHKPNRLPPSIRIPVTPGNRTLLRDLRAAEQAAWECALNQPQRNGRP